MATQRYHKYHPLVPGGREEETQQSQSLKDHIYMVADSSQLVSASLHTLAFWARMRVCEIISENVKNTSMREYENASLRE